VGREATRAVSGGRPSVAEALRARASLIYLQRPSLPTVWFASPNYFAQVALGVFRPDPYSKRCSLRRASLPSPRLLMADAGVCAASLLGELPQGS